MSTPVAVGTQFMREVNSSAILERLRAETTLSVSALAEATGLSRQAVSRSLNGLEDAGLIEFLAPDRSATRSGRPPQMVRFRAEAGFIVGASINPQHLHVAVADLVGNVVAAQDHPLGADTSGTTAAGALGDLVDSTLESANIPREMVWSASIGAPGIVDHEAGVIKLIPSMPGLRGDVLVRSLSERLGCPIHLDNDVKFATQGERWRGERRDDESLVLVHWGERVGAGIVLHGALFRGATNDAGDLGFLDLMVERSTPQAAEAHQGARGLGPFEAWVGADAIVRLASAACRDAADEHTLHRIERAGDGALDAVIDAALGGTPACVAAIREASARFAMGIAAIRSIIDPKLVVIGGPMSRCGDLVLDAVRLQLASQPLEGPRLEMSALGDHAVVHGAIHHSLDDIERTRYQRHRSQDA